MSYDLTSDGAPWAWAIAPEEVRSWNMSPVERTLAAFNRIATLAQPEGDSMLDQRSEAIAKAQDEVLAATARVAKQARKGREAREALRAAKAALREVSLPKEPMSGVFGSLQDAHPVVRFDRMIRGLTYTYVAVKVDGRWYPSGNASHSTSYSWTALLDYMGEHGQDTLQICQAWAELK